MHFISKTAKEYVDNQHSELTADQKQDLEKLRNVMVNSMNEIQKALVNKDFNGLRELYKGTNLETTIEQNINRQVLRIQKEEISLKNSNLYITILLETKDIEESLSKLLRVIFDATKNMPVEAVKPVINKEATTQNTEAEQKDDESSGEEAK